MSVYQVIVGNIGTVHTGKAKRQATAVFNTYVEQSKATAGRASGEQVTLMADSEPVREYLPPQIWRVWSLDVWGNEKDGFDVNDRCDVGRLELPAGADDKTVVRAMVDQGYLTSAKFHYEIDGDDMSMSIDHASTGRPLFQLELND